MVSTNSSRSSKKAKKTKRTKSTTKKRVARKAPDPSSPEDQDPSSLRLLKSNYKWEGAYPYIVETYKHDEDTLEVYNFKSPEEEGFETFLFEVVRNSNLPTWLKTNFIKIKKRIRDEIRHRSKLGEKLPLEQQQAIAQFFNDKEFFDRDEDDEFFDFELDKAAINFLRNILSTKNYEAFVRQGLRRRKAILSKHGRL